MSFLAASCRSTVTSAAGMGVSFHSTGIGARLSESSCRSCRLSQSSMRRPNRSSWATVPKALVTSKPETSCTRSQVRKNSQLIGHPALTMFSMLDTGMGDMTSRASWSPWRGTNWMVGV